ncbi:MAG: hypothetical protein B7733_09200 [Myxococcales bacterium FL481]|nr:MAG: hypothetical protein B7733_09200 [Myxococcales bacterium FL481]
MRLEPIVRRLATAGHATSLWRPTSSELAAAPDAVDIADTIAPHLVDERGSATRAVIVGHRAGLYVALELLRRHPRRVQGLVSLCGFEAARPPVAARTSALMASAVTSALRQTRLRRQLPFVVARRLAEWALERRLGADGLVDVVTRPAVPLFVLTDSHAPRLRRERNRETALRLAGARWEVLPHDCVGSGSIAVSVARRIAAFVNETGAATAAASV